MDEESDQEDGQGGSRRVSLPMALHNLLDKAVEENKEHIVSWVENGTAFKIHDRDAFINDMLPRFFKTTTFKSFQRSLNLWNFHLVRKGADKGYISHPKFRRGQRAMCQEIQRVIIKGTGKKRKPVTANAMIESNASVAALKTTYPQEISPVPVGKKIRLSAEAESESDSSLHATKPPARAISIDKPTGNLRVNQASIDPNANTTSSSSTETAQLLQEGNLQRLLLMQQLQASMSTPVPQASNLNDELLATRITGAGLPSPNIESLLQSAANAPQNGSSNLMDLLPLLSNQNIGLPFPSVSSVANRQQQSQLSDLLSALLPGRQENQTPMQPQAPLLDLLQQMNRNSSTPAPFSPISQFGLSNSHHQESTNTALLASLLGGGTTPTVQAHAQALLLGLQSQQQQQQLQQTSQSQNDALARLLLGSSIGDSQQTRLPSTPQELASLQLQQRLAESMTMAPSPQISNSMRVSFTNSNNDNSNLLATLLASSGAHQGQGSNQPSTQELLQNIDGMPPHLIQAILQQLNQDSKDQHR